MAAQKARETRSFLRRLATDTSANTLAIAAASLIPLVAMVGGGVDASRFYMAESRLQAACDAGALAARRAMQDTNFTDAHRAIGLDFFDQNFSDGMFGSTALQRNYTATAEGEVFGSATGNIPASIMAAFGFDEFPLNVECTADINISNTDIMFVLDTTASMDFRPDGSRCTGGCGEESRIAALRDSVIAFYDTVEASTSPQAQVRYGVLPYSSNVNVGQILLAENPSWLAQRATYQSRENEVIESNFVPISYDFMRTGPAVNSRTINTDNFNRRRTNRRQCENLFADREFADEVHERNEEQWRLVSATTGNPRTLVYEGLVTYNAAETSNYSYNRNRRVCQFDIVNFRYEAETTITVVEEGSETVEMVYRPVEWDISGLYDDNTVELRTGWNNTFETSRWDGCITEADTVVADNFDPVPAGALDLDINLMPSRQEEFWKPTLFGATWRRFENGGRTRNEVRVSSPDEDESRRPFYTCPQEAIRLTDMDRRTIVDYVNGLRARGSTYHDIGMIWGARFISPNGIFQDDNRSAPNGEAIARHIVFLTDGEIAPQIDNYTTYGTEFWDRLITTNGNNQSAAVAHAARFQAACRAARQENISVWVIAFGVTLTQNLIDCATPGRAFAASNPEELELRFREIAQQIAALRLTQ